MINSVGTMEPYKLRRWKIYFSPDNPAFFYTCARPGRSKGRHGEVPDDLVSAWVKGLSEQVQGFPGAKIAIISLLGRKNGPRGISEFSYYSFFGRLDKPSERENKLSFQEWLDRWHNDLQVTVHEYPTYDYDVDRYLPIQPEILANIGRTVWNLISEGRPVVVMDSGGVGRTGEVVEFLKATKVSLH